MFIKQLLDFKILDFTMTTKEMEGQEKQALVITTLFVKQLFGSNQFLKENTRGTASFLQAQMFIVQLLVGVLFMSST